MNRSIITPKEIDHYYTQYIGKLPEDTSLLKGFVEGAENVKTFFTSIPKEKLDYSYVPGKWTIKEVFQHLIDTERIFSYRAFRIARHDKIDLAGFDQNIYMEPSKAKNKSLEMVLNEFSATRASSIALIESLSDNDLAQTSKANNVAMSARGALFTVIGHDIWHMDVIKEKYS